MSNESNQNSESNNQLFLQDPLKFDQYSQISEDLSPLYEDLSTGRPTGLNGSESKKSVIVGNNNPLVALGKLGEISRTNSILSSIGESLPITSPLSASTPVFTSFSAGITQFFNPNAPALITSIEGINFNENGSNTGFFQIPPDPSGAAGLNHVVSVVNSSIEWHTKTGIQQNSQSLRNFFSAAVPGTTDDPLTGTFDPKVIYDQYSNRFVVVTLEQQGRDGGINNPSNDRSRIYVAVSDDADPNGTWFGYSINSLVNIGGTNYWADYPGFAVGQDAVYITNNVFKFDGDGAFGGSRLWVIPKTPFYSGGTPNNTIYDPSTLAGLGFQLGTLQPAHTFGTTPGNTGTFLVSTNVNTSVGGNDFVDVIRIDNPLGSPSFNRQAINVGDINTAFSLPGAPQSGTSTTVSTNDQRALNAVWRNNNLYLTNTVAPPSGPDAGQATAHWYQINTTNLNALTLADQGNIGGEDIAPNTSTFFPSIAVNSVGDVGIGFSASAATIFPGAYYTGRKASDLAGTVQSSGLLRAGQDSYVRTFGGPRNRWGDYSGASVDPSNDSFWVFNEYALTRGNSTGPGDDGRWGTAFGNFSLAATKSISIAKTTDGNEAGPVSSVFTLTRTGDLSSALIVNYTLGGTATPGVDYTGTTPNTVTFAALSPTATITLPTIDDSVVDPSETIITKITAPVGYTINGPDTATATIVDNDGGGGGNIFSNTSPITIPSSGTSTPYPSTINVSGLSGNINSLKVTLTNLSHTWPDDIDVLLVGPTGTKALLMSDVGGSNSLSNVTLTFDPTATSSLPDEEGLITSGSYKATDFETGDFFNTPAPGGPYGTDFSVFNGINPNGTWSLYVVDDVGGDAGTIAGGWSLNIGTASTAPTLAIAATNANQTEGNSGSKAFTFTVTRAVNTTGANNVNWAVTGSGTSAANATDFVGGVLPSGTVSFAAGETSKVITVNVQGDTTVEPNENFTVTLSNPTNGATITTATAVGTIQNDDEAVPTLAIAATNANQTEGNSGSKAFTFTVTRAVNTTGANNVNWAVTGSGTSAANATDFVGGVLPSGTVSFAAGETSKVITVNVQGDTTVEPNENFTVTLSNPTNGATITTATAVGTIQNDDGGTLPVVSLASNYSGVSENGKTNLVYNFTRSGATTNSLTVNFTLSGTATRGNDYNAYGGNFVSPTTGNIVFASGQTTAQIEIVTTGDTVKEANETIAFTLASGTGYTIGTPGAVTTTILNDDGVLNQQGTTGNDVIEAGTTRNLSGRAGHDILIGSNASDMLVGAAGNDTITSGAGFDVIAYSLASEGQDTITDFNVFQDTLQVSAAGFGGGLIAGESIAAAQFVLGTVATTASHRFIFNKPTGQLFFDVDGNGSSVQTLLATLTPNLNLTEDNIFAA
jgi:Ca2+-binding RTX toxin-like protein